MPFAVGTRRDAGHLFKGPVERGDIELTFFTGKSPTNGSKFEDTLIWKTYSQMSSVQVKFNLVPFETLTEKR
ncbi:hypothetical protein CPT76_18330, partial [Paenibacillus sp. AR247]